MLGVRDGYQNDAACTAMRAVRCPIVDGGTQSMPLSAALKDSTSVEGVDGTFQHRSARGAHKRCLPAAGAVVAGPAERATELGRR